MAMSRSADSMYCMNAPLGRFPVLKVATFSFGLSRSSRLPTTVAVGSPVTVLPSKVPADPPVPL